MKQFYILTISIILTTIDINAQNIETFEDEINNTTTFTTNGQLFTVESGTNENFTIVEKINFGWNASSATIDNFYIDNVSNVASNDGASFSIKTTDGLEFRVNSLYLVVGSDDSSGGNDLVTDETLTIEGKKDGSSVFNIIKTSGFASDFNTNGYTFIDFTSENNVNNSVIDIDELVFTSTNSADYLALDYLNWSGAVLSTSDFEDNYSVKLFQNPSSELIQLSGLYKTEKYKIYNILGSEIVNGSISNNESIDIKNLTNGLYYLKFDNGNTIKFLKE